MIIKLFEKRFLGLGILIQFSFTQRPTKSHRPVAACFHDPWARSAVCNESTTFKTSQICLDSYVSLLITPLLWNIHLNELMSLLLDLNRFTCSIFLDTVNLIGWECRPRPNHRASPQSLAANGRTKMVSVVSLSPREGETSWQVCGHQHVK